MRKIRFELIGAAGASIIVAMLAGQAMATPQSAVMTAAASASPQRQMLLPVQYRGEDVYESDDEDEAPPVTYVEPRPAREGRPLGYAPRVYGYTTVAPASCGEYRYWNGERCVDARYAPPDLGPRW